MVHAQQKFLPIQTRGIINATVKFNFNRMECFPIIIIFYYRFRLSNVFYNIFLYASNTNTHNFMYMEAYDYYFIMKSNIRTSVCVIISICIIAIY